MAKRVLFWLAFYYLWQFPVALAIIFIHFMIWG